jgi:hypothetical protein
MNKSIEEKEDLELRLLFYMTAVEMKRVFGRENTIKFLENFLKEEVENKEEEKPANPYNTRVPDDSVCQYCIGTLDDYCMNCNR